MSISYGFYNSSNGDRTYNASDFGSLFDGIFGDGIFTTLYNRFTVTYGGVDADHQGRDLFNVDTGKAWFNRTWITSTAEESLLCQARVSNLYRRDAIAIKIDQSLNGRQNSLTVITGNTAASASGTTCPMPSETDIYYYPIAYVVLPPLGTSEDPTVIDNRGSAECPYTGGTTDSIITVDRGGTGATSAPQALENLGGAPKVHTHSGDAITSGTVNADYIGGLPASKIVSGSFSADRIPSLSASKIGSGTLEVARGGTGVSASSFNDLLQQIGAAKASDVYTKAQVDEIIDDLEIGAIPATHITGTVPIEKGGTGGNTVAQALESLGAAAANHTHTAYGITSGTFDTARIPALDASKITSGTFADARIPSLAASKITSGTFSADRIPSLAASKITSGTFGADRIPSLDTSKLTSGTLGAARGGTGATTLSGALDGMLAAGRMKLSSYQYGANFPSSGLVSGMIFFKAV